MINKLPRWVEASAFVLAFIAGSINAIALLGFNHQGVSHLTGSSSLLGVELASGNYIEVVHLGWIILSFVVGAGVSGFVIGNESLKYGRRYGFMLLSIALLLLLCMYFLNSGEILGHYLASAACGLQNAMTSTFSGALVRTTHVTGLFTDLGIIIGLWLRGHAANRRRVLLYLTLITGFITGGLVGAISFTHLTFYAILIPAGLAASMALIYILFRKRLLQTSAS
jgi:uncharacterized membrane protein YoaK (UPF0700 family)